MTIDVNMQKKIVSFALNGNYLLDGDLTFTSDQVAVAANLTYAGDCVQILLHFTL